MIQQLFTGFRAFLFRGNVVDLAVAVIMGVAFGAVVDSLVKDLMTPLIAMVAGEPSFAGLQFTVNSAVFRYGAFLDQLISFLTVAAAVYFLIVLPVNTMTERLRRGGPPAEPTTRLCPECLSPVPAAARRCAFCTSALPAP